ncbi:Haloacid Dehalogenase Superfamily Class (subfamily) IIA [Pedococcus dokdonensis]|uniref:Haloacid Dehalogenase Superfamily Class (Subfamily) IIA n=1 Tax=Pedococcus dokdonensis TaxID=443156 RepID=A0A1H0PPT9_9MICO|nr:HAD-IIA family hydrolase [Pedococcus dokdonensis]SDP06810.1 Haloacid Dehalogenase Superfamily Class (subfamily) IIA [Pedococcus dokdonensis]
MAASSGGLADGYAAVVCDLDGVVYRGPDAVDHAVAALTALSIPIVYATNNASRTPDEVAGHLTDLGLHVRARDVATSSQAGAAALVELLPPGAPVLAIGGVGVREALQHQGLEVVGPEQTRESPERPVAGVLQGYGATVTAADLAEAAYAVAGGAVWVATNTDGTLPTHRGTAPGNGTLVAAVQRASGQSPRVVGKPYAPLYELCAARLEQQPSRLLAVGDRLDTDIAGAVAAGMDSALVLTGIDSVSTLAGAPAALRPTYLLEDLRSLTTEYAPAETDYAWWVCGGDRRRVVEGAWEVATRGTSIEAARAGIACLHEGLDLGDLDEQTVRRLVAEIDAWQ